MFAVGLSIMFACALAHFTRPAVRHWRSYRFVMGIGVWLVIASIVVKLWEVMP